LLANNNTTCGTAGGTHCDLSDNGGIARDTTNFMEGTQACLYDVNEFHQATDATAPELRCLGDCTFGMWARPTLDASMRAMMKGVSINGYMLLRSATNDRAQCFVGDGSSSTISAANNTLPIDTWAHIVCRENDTADNQQMYVNGVASGTGATQSGITTSTAAFGLSDVATTFDWLGQEDEAFVCNKNLADTAICRICSCGVDGTVCLCDASNHANFKSCTVDSDCQALSAHGRCDTTSGTCQGRNHATPGCSACTLPTCNVAAP